MAECRTKEKKVSCFAAHYESLKEDLEKNSLALRVLDQTEQPEIVEMERKREEEKEKKRKNFLHICVDHK